MSLLKDKIKQINTWENFGDFWEIFLIGKRVLDAKDAIESAINDFLDWIDVTEDNYPKYLKESSDFWNDENENGICFADSAHEWADDQVDIYWKDLYENAWDFCGFEDEYVWQFGKDQAGHAIEEGGIPRLLQQIQYTAYSQFSSTVLQLLSES